MSATYDPDVFGGIEEQELVRLMRTYAPPPQGDEELEYIDTQKPANDESATLPWMDSTDPAPEPQRQEARATDGSRNLADWLKNELIPHYETIRDAHRMAEREYDEAQERPEMERGAYVHQRVQQLREAGNIEPYAQPPYADDVHGAHVAQLLTSLTNGN